MMKRILIYMLCATAVMTAGCAKSVEEGPNVAAKRYFDAWLHVNYPGLEDSPVGLGIYEIENTEGYGDVVERKGYAICDYIITDLDGNIASYTDRHTALQLGDDSTGVYFGPKVITTTKNTIQAGVAEGLVGMKVGGHKKFIIPSWLMSYSSYSSAKDYLANKSSFESSIYDVSVRDFTKDILKWQVDSIGRFFNTGETSVDGKPAKEVFAGMTAKDSVTADKGGAYGFYYKSIVTAPASTEAFPSDTTVYINYTGKLLNGLIFDTTIEKVAIDNDIYSSSKTYGPVPVSWGEKYSELKLNGSSVVNGFAMTLWQMKAGEKGIGVFYSALGYGYSGSPDGKSIPPYAPLIFEIEMTSDPDEEE